MSIKKETLKTTGVMLLLWAIIIFRITNFSVINQTTIFITVIAVIFIAIYLLLLKNKLDLIKNEYENDINEYNKQWDKRFKETQGDLEKRGMTFSGEAVKKLGNKSACNPEILDQPIPKGELEIDKEDYEKYRTKKFELDFKGAKYKIITNLFKK